MISQMPPTWTEFHAHVSRLKSIYPFYVTKAMAPYSIFRWKPNSYLAVPHSPPHGPEDQEKEGCAVDLGHESRNSTDRRARGQKLLAVCLSLVLFSTILVGAALRITGRRLHQSNHTTVASTEDDSGQLSLCGNSSAEALARGCTFDQLMWSWYPPSCPHYKNKEYLRAEEWTFYLDTEGKEVATGDMWRKAIDNEVPLWGERREHLTHCVYLFLSLGQIIREGSRFPAIMVEDEHLDHCAKKILASLRRDEDWNLLDTAVPPVEYSVSC